MTLDALCRQLDAVSQEAVRAWAARHSDATLVEAPPAEDWPFIHPLAASVPASPVVIWVPNVHEAFVNHQTASTRLVTTQPMYLMQVWLDALDTRDDALIVATANREVLSTHAPEVLARRGPYANPRVHVSLGASSGSVITGLLPLAMRATDPTERLRLCVAALDRQRVAPTLLAAASACMEVNDLDAAARDLDEALAQAPNWAAAHFERGKLWLRLDDMESASASFQEAVSLMPAFASAWANLGATLGELDKPEDALDAFEHAMARDPANHQALNNVGVVRRELGKLAESETAFRRVIELTPELAFGYYNLGHTLFLQGRYHEALSAYVEGQKRDPERNPVQASRLALCRLASGDAAGALADLQRATQPLPREYRQQLLADTNTIAWALLTHRPDLPGWKQINDWLMGELGQASGVGRQASGRDQGPGAAD